MKTRACTRNTATATQGPREAKQATTTRQLSQQSKSNAFKEKQEAAERANRNKEERAILQSEGERAIQFQTNTNNNVYRSNDGGSGKAIGKVNWQTLIQI